MQLFAIIPQPLGKTDSPTFAGLTITSNSVFGLNSAVFQPAIDGLTFFQVLDADGGVPVFNVDTFNEGVGVKTATPLATLHVNGTGAFGDSVNAARSTRALNLISTDAAMRIWRYLGDTDYAPAVELIWGNTGDDPTANGNFMWDFFVYGLDGSFNIRDRSFGQGNVQRMSIDTNGVAKFFASNHEVVRLVGIGATDGPYLSFYQGATRRSYIQHHDTNDELKLRSEYGKIGLWTGVTERLTILNGGNVGIGETTPTAALQMGDDKLIAVDTNAGITASTTQTQGNGALTAQVNEISTVANDDDTVTLPTAVTGIMIEIINNGANTLQIFPASGDNLGLGVNTAEELEANERVVFVAYNTTNWAKESSTEIIHAEIHDEDNTDAFVINDAGGDFHSYHTNGLAAGDLADWAFDAGGAGTSFPIASIADGADSGVDIAVTTTGLHGLEVGDIISQTNLTNAAYVGIFDVKAIISTTVYEVAAVYTATGTGTIDQAATLEANAVAAGVYDFAYYISGTLVGNNETFDFQLYREATAVTGSKIRRKFGAANDFGSMSGGGVVSVANGDKISFALSNEDSAANIILRNLTIVLIRL